MRTLGLKMVVVSTLVLACGVEDEPTEAGPVAIVFDVDHLDVIGPLRISIDGEQELVLDPDENFASCDRPAFYAEADSFGFEAENDFGLFWKEEVDLLAGESCRVISLHLLNQATGFAFYSKVHRSECFPIEGFLSLDLSSEQPIGQLLESWKFDFTVFPEYPTSEMVLVHLMDAVRHRKAWLFGSGRNPEARYELRTESLGCDSGGLLSGGLVAPGGFEILSSDST